MYCHDTMDCFLLPGYTCQMGRCICDQERHTGLFSCIPARIHGDKCQDDLDCRTGDVNLVCIGLELRTCRCRRGLVWDIISKRCYRVDEDNFGGKFDPIRDLIIPGIIVMTIGAMMYLGIKLFCNCGKIWHRRRHQDTTQDLAESHHHSGTWVTSYRVVGPLAGLEGGTASINGTQGVVQGTTTHLHHSSASPSCVSLFVPNTASIPAVAAATTANGTSSSSSSAPPLPPPPTDGPIPPPPPYEEALRHKVVLSSFPPLPSASRGMGRGGATPSTIVTLVPSALPHPPNNA